MKIQFVYSFIDTKQEKMLHNVHSLPKFALNGAIILADKFCSAVNIYYF